MDYTDNAVTSAAQNSFKMAIRSAGRPSESTACIHAFFFQGIHLSGLPRGKRSQLAQHITEREAKKDDRFVII